MRIVLIVLSFLVFHTGIAQDTISIEEMENIFPSSVLKCKLHQDLQSTELLVKSEGVKNVSALYSNKQKTIEMEWLRFTNPGRLYKEAVLPLSKELDNGSDIQYSKNVSWNGREGILTVNSETHLYSVLIHWDGVNVLTITFDGCASEEEIRKAYDALQWSENK